MTETRAVLVTGGSGYIGRRLVPALLTARGAASGCLVRSARAGTILVHVGLDGGGYVGKRFQLEPGPNRLTLRTAE